MSGNEEEDASRTLEFTPTWVVAGVCTVIVLISLFAERFLHYLGKFLKHKRQDSLFQALQKLKEELMLLGFISLLLTVFQSSISHICIRKSVTSQMLPCKKDVSHLNELMHHEEFFTGDTWKRRRLLSVGHGSNICTSQGKVPLLSIEALHQLHIFIFVLAIVHVTFCATTIVLSGFKIRKWKQWEQEIQNEILNENEPLPHHNLNHEFVNTRAIGYWRKSVVISWMMSFFKQFHASVTKHDYRALRYGFIMTHCRMNPKFYFHKYMLRALEDDFKKIVGISWYLWLFVIVFLLLDVHVAGEKLEHIITQLALDIEVKSSDENAGQVKPSDHHFWFRTPAVMLYLAHFILFQNAFEIAFFF